MTFAINSIGTLETNHEFQAQSNTLLAVHIHKQRNNYALNKIEQLVMKVCMACRHHS